MIIYLIGPGGVGKTTTGKILSEKIKLNFIDLDEEFCRRIQNIGDFIRNFGYQQYCYQNSELFYQILKENGKDVIFALSSGFLVHEGLENLVVKHKETLKQSGISILLLPSRSKKLSSEIVVKRQLKRGFGLIEKREKEKFLDRFPKYIKMGDIRVFSHKDPEDIAKIVEEKIRSVFPQITVGF